MDGGSLLQHLEVVLFVTGVLVQDEEVRSQQADCEPQVELPDDAHLGEVLLRWGTEMRTDVSRLLHWFNAARENIGVGYYCSMHS